MKYTHTMIAHSPSTPASTEGNCWVIVSLKTWIASLAQVQQGGVLEDEEVVSYIRSLNARNFLRSLHFLLQWNNGTALAEQKAELQARMDQALRKLNPIPVEQSPGS